MNDVLALIDKFSLLRVLTKASIVSIGSVILFESAVLTRVVELMYSARCSITSCASDEFIDKALNAILCGERNTR